MTLKTLTISYEIYLEDFRRKHARSDSRVYDKNGRLIGVIYLAPTKEEYDDLLILEDALVNFKDRRFPNEP